jgi:hypothetical protein
VRNISTGEEKHLQWDFEKINPVINKQRIIKEGRIIPEISGSREVF